jgi:hypothetical protein
MTRLVVTFSLVLAIVPSALGRADKQTAMDVLSNARSVYITSPSGDEFGMFPLPEDKEALVTTRRVIADGQRLSIVYDRESPDIIVIVRSRASRDEIRIFNGHSPSKCVWHLAAKGGLRASDPSLARALEAELENAAGTPLESGGEK